MKLGRSSVLVSYYVRKKSGSGVFLAVASPSSLVLGEGEGVDSAEVPPTFKGVSRGSSSSKQQQSRKEHE